MVVGQVFLLFPLGGWALMLLLGIAHHQVAPSVPPLGFGSCVAVVALGACVKSAVAPNWPEVSR